MPAFQFSRAAPQAGQPLVSVVCINKNNISTLEQSILSVLSQTVVQWLFIGAVVVHIAEATYAHRVAVRAGFASTARGWFWQTLALGFPSLKLLRAKVAGGEMRKGEA